MSKVYASFVEYQKDIEAKCNIAVKRTCDRLLGTLQQIIFDSYYDQFEPDYYERTWMFYESATSKMLNKCFGEVYMDKEHMNYGSYWSGELQLEFASRGYHGSTNIQSEGRFWKEFEEFCDNNALAILKEELKKQKVPILN